jgi:hypothetical protein
MAVDGVPMQVRSAVGILSPTAIAHRYRPPFWSRCRVQRGASMQTQLSPGVDPAAGSRWKRVGQVVTVDGAEWRV